MWKKGGPMKQKKGNIMWKKGGPWSPKKIRPRYAIQTLLMKPGGLPEGSLKGKVRYPDPINEGPEAFQKAALAIIIERQHKLNFSGHCQTKFLLPKSQMNSTVFLRFLTLLQFCTHSAGKTKAKQIENYFIFHVPIQIRSLTMFSVQSKYSKIRSKVSCCSVSSSPNKTCRTWNVQIQFNHHRWAHRQGEIQIHFVQGKNTKWIHRAREVKVSHAVSLLPLSG